MESTKMNIDVEFQELFDELQEKHLKLREKINSFSVNDTGLESILIHEIQEFDAWRFPIMDKLGLLTSNYDKKKKKYYKEYITRTKYFEIVQEAPFYWRIINKPNGYAGDAFLIDYIYQNRFEGNTPFGKLLHKHAISTLACQSVRNRKAFLKDQIVNLGGGNVLSVAAGPAQEIREVLTTPNAAKYCFHALDHDMDALTTFSDPHLKGSFEYFLANAFQIASGNYTTSIPRKILSGLCYPSKDFKGFRKIFVPLKYKLGILNKEYYDLIYSAGLYDYFITFILDPSKGTIALTSNLFELLKPGGTLIIGNFSPNNPRDLRFVMEYIYDWNLFYRTREEMIEFASNLPKHKIRKIEVLKEPLGINYLLKIEKMG